MSSDEDLAESDWEAYEAGFTTGSTPEFLWLEAVLAVPGPLPVQPDRAAAVRAALKAGADLVTQELPAAVPLGWETLWTPGTSRNRRRAGLDLGAVTPDATSIKLVGKVPWGSGVPSGSVGDLAFASATTADIGDGVERDAPWPLSEGVLGVGAGLVQGALPGGTAGPEVQLRFVEWAVRTAEAVGAYSGFVTIDLGGSSTDSAYRAVTGAAGRGNARTDVYGYGPWTLLNPAQVDRLGGAQALATALTGVGDVRAVDGGFTLVSLGPDANAVTTAQLRALRDALAPVLTRGQRSVEEYFDRSGARPVQVVKPYRI